MPCEELQKECYRSARMASQRVVVQSDLLSSRRKIDYGVLSYAYISQRQFMHVAHENAKLCA